MAVSIEFLHMMDVEMHDKNLIVEDYNTDWYIHDLYDKIRELEKRVKDLEDADKED